MSFPPSAPAGAAFLHVHTILDLATGQVLRTWSDAVDGDGPGEVRPVLPKLTSNDARNVRERQSYRADRAAAMTGDEAASQRMIDRGLRGNALHADFDGRAPSDILRDPDVRVEMSALKALGCNNEFELVLRGGIHRCRQSRIWVEKRRATQAIEKPAALVASLILNGFQKKTPV